MAPVEAASLSDLNLLAANPPAYPYNPAEGARAPLTLYVSRVPGTRDIILSPLKPIGKNVTVSDVASALYYVHLDAPGEGLPTDASPGEHHTPPRIARKPIKKEQAPVRKPVPAPRPTLRTLLSRDKVTPETAPPVQPVQPIPRKPLSTRAVSPDTTQDDPDHDHDHDHDQEEAPPLPPRDPARQTANPHPLPPLPMADNARDTAHPPQVEQPDSSPSSAPSAAFRLTLIRRDPSDDRQWNIGKIAGVQATPADKFPPLHIRIDTSGYAKFHGRPSRQAVAAVAQALSPAALKQTVEGHGGLGVKAEEAGILVREPPGFARDLVMAYRPPSRWTAGLRSAWRGVQAQAKGRGHAHGHARTQSEGAWSSSSSGPWHRRSTESGGSRGSVASAAGSYHHEDDAAAEAPRPSGYTFASPWDTPCAFRTSRGGHRMTCRHALAPGAAAAGAVAAGKTSLRAAVTGTGRVSELRFNLPGSHSQEEDDGWGESEGEEEEGESDGDSDGYALPHLGRERAGGGARGTRPKLGKLIVYDDGFKMLDLVVAANMGVWWVAWEGGF